MNESRLNQERMSTADIVYPERSQTEYRDRSAVAVEEVPQPGMQELPANTIDGKYALDPEGPLFADGELKGFRTRWDQVQASFVDEPREAVRSADSLVANVVQRIAEQFAQERDQLERQWDSGTNVSTEDLRQSLKRYRALFGRLLAF